jgi:hypothetical protein
MPISNDCAAEEILLWIHKGQVVTAWSSVVWTNHLDLSLRNQSDRSMQDNRVGIIRIYSQLSGFVQNYAKGAKAAATGS